VPGVVLLPTVRVRVELAPAEIGLELKPALVPAGTPVALRVTLWAEPLVITVEMVLLALLPWEAVTLLGLALIEKSEGGAAVTVRLTDVECVALLPVPVTVTV
jgi:hypothetical protein